MLELNGKVLSNEQIIEMLGEKITRPITFRLGDQFKSRLRYVTRGESKWTERWQENFGLSNFSTYRDFQTGGNNTLIYYTSVIGDPNKPQERRYVVGNTMNKIEFHKGLLQITEGQEDLLLFLRTNEQCSTNKYWEMADARGHQKYRPTKAFLYKEVIPEKESEQTYDLIHNKLKAQTAALDPKRIPYEAAVVMATAYGYANARYNGNKAVRQFLYEKATANPDQFLTDMTSSAFDIKSKVQSAIEFRIITFDAPYWRWVGENKKFGDGRICVVPTGQDKIDYFVQWMRETDKSGVMEELKEMVEKAMEKTDENFVAEEKKPVDEILALLGATSLEELQSKLSNADKIILADAQKKKGQLKKKEEIIEGVNAQPTTETTPVEEPVAQ